MIRSKRRYWATIAGMALLIGGVAYLRRQPPSFPGPETGAPEPPAQSEPSVVPVPSPELAGRAPSASARSRRVVANLGASPLSARAPEARPGDSNGQLVDRWFDAATGYHGRDRAAVIDQLTTAIVSRGAKMVPELENHLRNTTVYRQTDRAAAFHALGRVGTALKTSGGREAAGALAVIHQLADKELALPEFVPPNPETNLDALPAGDRYELVHRGILVEHGGGLSQTTTLSKLAAIQMLMDIGDANALAQLQAIQETKDNSVGVRLATARAIRAVGH